MACTSDHAAEDALLKARLSDAVDLCDRRSCPRFVGFLDERQRAVAEAFLRPYTAVSICFFGGHPEAERTIAGIFPPFLPAEEDAFPLAAVGFTYRREASLSHRDFLGALLSGLLATCLKNAAGYPRISVTVPSIVIMVPGLYFYRAIYNLGIMSLTDSATWFADAILIIVALPLGLIFARIITDRTFRYCT